MPARQGDEKSTGADTVWLGFDEGKITIVKVTINFVYF